MGCIRVVRRGRSALTTVLSFWYWSCHAGLRTHHSSLLIKQVSPYPLLGLILSLGTKRALHTENGELVLHFFSLFARGISLLARSSRVAP